MIEEVVKFLGGTTIVVGAVAWLIRSVTVHLLSKDVESYKAKLREESFEHEQKLSRLLDRRAEVIAELYKRLIVFLGEAASFAHPIEYANGPTKQEKINALADAAENFRGYFNENRIFFSRSICSKVDALWDEIFKSTNRYAFWLRRDKEAIQEKTLDAWDKAWETISKRAPELTDEIQDEFRELLGVEK